MTGGGEPSRIRRRRSQEVLPPSGTVTFLLTDIEASTSRWEANRPAMAEALRRHDSLVRKLTQQGDGFIVESGREGDSVLVAFRRVSDAVACALNLQLAFGQQAWPAGAELRVRMALHTGDAEFRDGHYYGLPINRCARLLAAGHGGQILITSATRDLVAGVLPELCSLADLGLHHLKDLPAAEHVFQVVHPDLHSVFPALKSLEPPLPNLPIPLTSFVGRERALEELTRALSEKRLVTLIGPGGCGKTRLAMQVAMQISSTFPDGVWFVDLVPVSDPSLVSQKILATLGLREHADRREFVVPVDFLKSKRALLILDNCEQVAEAVAEFADTVLRAAPNLSVLATSRELLRVPGEVAFPVTPLTVPGDGHGVNTDDLRQSEAVRLFTERAALRSPSFALTMENSAAVAAICRQLDGLPLAIELAAARIAVLSPQQFLSRLGGQLKLLSKAGRITSPKQQTLEATFEWSYRLLDDRERAVFRRLSVFSAPFSLEDVEAVCAGDGIASEDVLDLITQLNEKSLVVTQRVHGEEVRYRLLQTVRQYARSRLEGSGEATRLQLRLARLCASLAQQAMSREHSPEGPAWMDVLEDQNDNLRAVLDWCRAVDPALGLRLAVDLIDFWDFKGHLTEGRRWLATFRELNSASNPFTAGALAGAGLLAWRQGDNLAAREQYEECLAMGRSMSDDKVVARALRGLGDVLVNLGDYGKSETNYRESLAILSQGEDNAEIAETLSRLGNAILLQGGVDGSIPVYEESLTHYRRLGDQMGVANQLWSLGAAESIGGRYSRAYPYLEECLRIRESIGDELGVPYAQHMLAYTEIQLGNLGDARTHERLALPRIWEFGDRWGTSLVLTALIGLATGEGVMRDALRLAGASEAVRESIGAHQLAWLQPVVDGWLAESRRVLKPEEVDRAYREGRDMSPEDAVKYALGYIAEDPLALTSSGSQRVLSSRELEVAQIVAEGLTNREIAQRLFISERTVDNHVKHILEKLEFRSRAQVGAWLLEQHPSSSPR